jgi:hypothetical protein
MKPLALEECSEDTGDLQYLLCNFGQNALDHSSKLVLLWDLMPSVLSSRFPFLGNLEVPSASYKVSLSFTR